ncbi:MAG: heavy-metal-associated domain-containing protein [bacterium]|nr:heavy-metal-associated domain-containing protein [bacterium]
MKTLTLSSPGISCHHCAGTIEKTISQMKEVDEVTVDVDAKKVNITLNGDVDTGIILSAMEEAGYPAAVEAE